MELDHLLTRSGLTYPEVSSKVCHDSFYKLVSSVPLPCVINFEEFYLRVVSIPKHACPEAKGSNPTTGLTLLWVVTHSGEILTTGKSHEKKPDRFSLNVNMDVRNEWISSYNYLNRILLYLLHGRNMSTKNGGYIEFVYKVNNSLLQETREDIKG